MKIHEYQGKDVFRRFGIAVPRGIAVFSVAEAVKAARQLGGPVWVVKAQIHAGGRGKGGGVKLARSIEDVEKLASSILGMNLVTHQTGPEGQVVRRLLIEEGADIKKEYYVGMVLDRAAQRVTLMASAEGGVNIEEVAEKTPEKIVKAAIDPVAGLTDRQADEVARGIGIPEASVAQARELFQRLLQGLRGDRRLARRSESDDPHRRRQGDRAGRQAQLRQQRAVPAPRDHGAARPRRGGPARDRGLEVRPFLHLARRQHRLPRQRRRPGDGDDGRDQAVRRRARELPRRRRRRDRRRR